MGGVIYFLCKHGLICLVPAAAISWLVAAIKGQKESDDYLRYFFCALIPIIGLIVWYVKWNDKDENASPCLWATGLGFIANIISILILVAA